MKFFLIIIITLNVNSTLNSQVFYVSPKGSDNNPGTILKPFKTFKRSVEAIKENGKKGTVYFRGGNYYFDTTVVINNDNCRNTVTFAAYKNEIPVFTSGYHLIHWVKINSNDPGYKFLSSNAKDNVFVCTLPRSLGLLRFLKDSKSDWLEQGRVNVTSLVTTKKYLHGESVEGQMWDPPEEKTVATFSHLMTGYSNVDSALMFSIYTSDFSEQVLPVKEIKGNTLITTVPGGHRLALPDKEQRHGSNQLAFLYNLLEGINVPGEWAFNPESGKIYLWPKNGIKEIYAPLLNELIEIDGVPSGKKAWFTSEKENPVRDITFTGITFTNCKQPIWKTNDVSAQHGWAMIDKDNALLRFRGAKNCKILNCKFVKSGGAGVAFDLYAQYNIVTNCKFDHLGCEAIRIAGYGIGKKDDSKYNIIRQSEISNVNELYHYGAAIVLWNTGFNKIVGNYIHNTVNKVILLSAPRSRAFTKNNQALFQNNCEMREQAWPMARWFEIPDSALATIYYAEEEGEKIRRVEVDGIRQGDPGGGIADRRCSHFRYLRGNLIERNIIGNAAEGLFCDGIFYITGTASNEPNIIHENYIYNTGYNLPLPDLPFRLIYLDGYSGKLDFTGNICFNDSFRFEVMAFYNWWDKVTSYSNVFYNVKGEDYKGGEGNLFFGKGPNNPNKKFVNEYWNIIQFLKNYSAPAQHPLPGADIVISEIQNVLENF